MNPGLKCLLDIAVSNNIWQVVNKKHNEYDQQKNQSSFNHLYNDNTDQQYEQLYTQYELNWMINKFGSKLNNGVEVFKNNNSFYINDIKLTTVEPSNVMFGDFIILYKLDNSMFADLQIRYQLCKVYSIKDDIIEIVIDQKLKTRTIIGTVAKVLLED